MNSVDRSIEIAKAMFPGEYDPSYGYRTYHFAFLWKRNNLLSIGVNDPANESARAINIARRFRINKMIEFPYLHAEMDAIAKLWGREHIDSKMTFIVLRLNKHLELMPSKPCWKCDSVIRELSLDRKLYYSIEGGIERL